MTISGGVAFVKRQFGEMYAGNDFWLTTILNLILYGAKMYKNAQLLFRLSRTQMDLRENDSYIVKPYVYSETNGREPARGI